MKYQRVMEVYYDGDPERAFTKKTSFATKENAIADLKKIEAKQTGTNEDHWEIVRAAVIDKETGEQVYFYLGEVEK